MSLKVAILLVLMLTGTADGGPLFYVACQASCVVMVSACYVAAGFVFGTVTAGIGTPGATISCNVAYVKCQVTCTCTFGFFVPTP